MVVAGSAFIALGVGESTQAVNFKIVASGLDNPRKLTFGPDGDLYVTEAGRGGTGPCFQGPEGYSCYGLTGAVTRIHKGTKQSVVTGLPSLASPNGSNANGPTAIAFGSSGKAYVLIGLGAAPSIRNQLNAPNLGKLLVINNINKINQGASLATVADIAGYEALHNPDGARVDSNPYDLLIKGGTAFVVDAGGNDLLSVNLNNSNVGLKTVFPTRKVANPAGGSDIPLESVPTTVEDCKGSLYVGELTGVPFPVGAANIYQVGANNQPTIYARGFTNVIDIAFAPQGGLYVLEYAKNSISSGNQTGALIYVAPNGNRSTIASDGLINPTGLAVDRNGTIYISNNSMGKNNGQIISISAPKLK